MRFTTLLLFALVFASSQAQETEAELKYGDTLYFGNCTELTYSYIDLYQKTRFELDSISYDTIVGWDFYNRFFNDGDFDVTRLPSSYQGKYGIIKHMMAIQDENNQWINIIIVMIKDGKSAGYIVEEAFANEEVIYSPSL